MKHRTTQRAVATMAIARLRIWLGLLLFCCASTLWPSSAFSAPPTATVSVSPDRLGIGQTAEVTIVFSEPVAGFTLAALGFYGATPSSPLTTADNKTYTITLTPVPDITDATNHIVLNLSGVTNGGNETGNGSVTSNNYAVDTMRPTATIVVANTDLRAGETSVVTITFSEAVGGFDNADLSIPNGTLSAVSSWDGGITWTATFTPWPHVKDTTNRISLNMDGVTDLVGNPGSDVINSGNFMIDTVRPTATIVVHNPSMSLVPGYTTSLVTIMFSEAVAGFSNADLTISNGTLSQVMSGDGEITWTATFTPSANVTATLNLITLDMTGVYNAASNTGTGTVGSNNFAIDTKRPTATVVVANPSLVTGGTSDVTIAFSEPVSGVSNNNVIVSNGTLTALASSDGGATWTATLTAVGAGSYANNVLTLDMNGVKDAVNNAAQGTVDSNNYTINAPSMSLPASLPDGFSGQAYSQTLTVTGGTAPYTFSIAAGSPPTGLTLDPQSGTLSGTPSTVGSFTFTVKAMDALSFPISQEYTVEVTEPTPVAVSRRISVEAGKQVVVELSDGATGGPFTAATLVSSLPAAAGPASISGTQLTFNAAVTFEGTATVVFTLNNAFSTSAQATIYFDVTGRPDPSRDAEVTGLLTAQADSARRFAGAQTQNFNARLEQLHDEGDRRRNSMAVRLGYAGNDRKRDEDRRFEDLLGKPPATEAGGGFATHNYASDGKNGGQPAQPPIDVDLGKLAVWTGGFVNFGKRDDGKLSLDYTTAGVSGGIDYRFSKSLVAGFGVGYGRDATDIGSNGTKSRAHAYSGAVYASYSPFKSAYLDGVIGGSWLDLSSKRYETPSGNFATGDRSGSQIFGSVTASYERRSDAWLVSPYGRLDFSRSWLGSFTETGSDAYLLKYGNQSVDTLSGIAGLRLEYALPTDWGVLTPGARIEYVHDFEGSSQASIGYADTVGLPFAYRTDGSGSDYVTLGASLDASLEDDWTARFDYRTAVGGIGQSHAFGLRVGKNF